MAGYLVFDVESIPDGNFISRTKYPGENLDAKAAIARAEHEAKADSNGRTDFIPLTFHVPVATGVARLDDNFFIKKLWVFDGDQRQITEAFWKSYAKEKVTLISFNGRTFDLPLLELMAFKHGVTIHSSYWEKYGPRNRFSDAHVDLMEWMGNTGAHRVVGGLDALAKLLNRTGKPVTDGQKMDGSHVRKLYEEGQQAAINAYCTCDVLDTYAVFLRSRVMMGQLSPDQEAALLVRADELKPK